MAAKDKDAYTIAFWGFCGALLLDIATTLALWFVHLQGVPTSKRHVVAAVMMGVGVFCLAYIAKSRHMLNRYKRGEWDGRDPADV
jgi:hypothetical protein